MAPPGGPGRGDWAPRRAGSRERAAALRQRAALGLISAAVVVAFATFPPDHPHAEPSAARRGSRWNEEGVLLDGAAHAGEVQSAQTSLRAGGSEKDGWHAAPQERAAWGRLFSGYAAAPADPPQEEETGTATVTVSLENETWAPVELGSGGLWAQISQQVRAVPSPCGADGVQVPSRGEGRFELCVHRKEDVISSFFIRDGRWRDCRELPQLYRIALRGSEEPGTVVDVGANIGACTMELAAMGARVIAFEPVAENFRLLNRSIALNGFSAKVTAHHVALGFERGPRQIMKEVGNFGNAIITTWDKVHDNDRWYQTAFEKEDVQLGRLDDFVSERVHLLKLDCQGYELRVLRGATRLLQRHRVDLVRAEVDPRLLGAVGDLPSDLFEFLHDLGFDVFVVDDSDEFEGAHGSRWLRPSEYQRYSARLVEADTSTHVNATRSAEAPRGQLLSRFSIVDGEEHPDSRRTH
eukprot:TRINITY_DN25173_c0_g1_i1.p1 TRINITY_DN25173_c0_g1~~TRINITY_DN25173_c0_g1_i1.p1  ORF type:complete len:467 (+),score=135.51 TRINITY_DN25173_c0_g1_i1:85-1485(+)